uniref:Uncharacterized protein n=1 Tax=Rhizophora mucronata TaxID=61149 RepID=A0A2P2NY31_RHIMU
MLTQIISSLGLLILQQYQG